VDRDPVRQGRAATELLAVYQQRSIELARLRRAAIERLREERGLSYAAIAKEFGLSKGRVGQIRQSAPPLERAFFGVGPVTVALPLRDSGRAFPVIASEDALSGERVTALLEGLQLDVKQFRIPTDGAWNPTGDVVAICGPKSSPVTADALTHDPVLDFRQAERGWSITDRATGTTYRSPMDEHGSRTEDIAYLGRVPIPGGTMLLIAGIHALGSVGAVDYLTTHVADLYEQVGHERFSMVVASRHDGEHVEQNEALCPPQRHG